MRILLLLGLLVSISQFSIGAEATEFLLGDKKVKFTVTSNSADKQKVILLALHGSEKTSSEAASKVISEFNGKLAIIENKTRRIYFGANSLGPGVDPNRIFSDFGIAESIKPSSSKAEFFEICKSFRNDLIEEFEIKPETVVIALHNNWDNDDPDKGPGSGYGQLSIKYFMDEGPWAQDSADCYPQKESDLAIDADNFFLVTERTDFEALKEAGFNVALQDENVEDDGSLSVYCQKNNIRYFNVEAQRDDFEYQIEMIQFISELLSQGE